MSYFQTCQTNDRHPLHFCVENKQTKQQQQHNNKAKQNNNKKKQKQKQKTQTKQNTCKAFENALMLECTIIYYDFYK